MLNYKTIFKITSKSKIKPELQMLYVKGGHVYATDSFKAIKLKTNFENEVTGYITKLSAIVGYEKSKEFGVEVLPEIKEATMPFPDIERVIEHDSLVSFTVNRQYLIDILEAMQKPLTKGKKGFFDEITITVQKTPTKPVILENENGTGLIMPVNK